MHINRAPAKINLGLHVLRRRSDGYHDIETVLLPIQWHDTVTVRGADHLTMTCSDPDLPTDERNLCMQAARQLMHTAAVTAGAELHLEKQIPYGAGLGGGSSDAAVTLQLLARLWDISYTDGQLHAVARQLGADVPFFLRQTAAYAAGRGDDLDYFDGGYRFSHALVVVKPPVSISTPEAYQLVNPHAENRPDLRDLVCSNDLSAWRLHLTNDFERPIFSQYPEVANVKRQLLKHRAAYASLSGSGSAVYGVFTQEAAAKRAANRFKSKEGYTVWWGRAVR